MIAYWDSSAVVEALQDPAIRKRLRLEGGVTRSHTLAEVFSTLTGGRLGFRCQPDDASQMIAEVAGNLKFVELDARETLHALLRCHEQGVRGGLVHDFLHAIAAEKARARKIITLNQKDFIKLHTVLAIELP